MISLGFYNRSVSTINSYLVDALSMALYLHKNMVRKRWWMHYKIFAFRKYPHPFAVSGTCLRHSNRNGILNSTLTIECRVSKNYFTYHVPFNRDNIRIH